MAADRGEKSAPK